MSHAVSVHAHARGRIGRPVARVITRYDVIPDASLEVRIFEICSGAFAAGRVPDIGRNRVGALVSVLAVEAQTPLELRMLALSQPVDVRLGGLAGKHQRIRTHPDFHGQSRSAGGLAKRRAIDIGDLYVVTGIGAVQTNCSIGRARR